ncbi:MAG: ABC transporter permease subunit, partial [Alphaproteobacteria bacterium]|nr:ABC transporter permease subunit [Alphaproteobacteria bacterium]
AGIASVMLIFVFALFTIERISRGAARYDNATGTTFPVTFARLTGWRAAGAVLACAIPVLVGFLIPLIVLVDGAWKAGWDGLETGFLSALYHSLLLAGISAVVCVAVGLLLAYAQRISPSPAVRSAVRFSSLGYAIPGTVLGLGLLIPLAGLDNHLSALTIDWFGFSTGQLFAGTVFTIVLAYTIRYLAVSLGAIEAGFHRISPNLDAAARTQGDTPWSILHRVHIPILLPALGAAALMVFVDAMKELPATLLLRPFNFETLATQVYNAASIARFETASLSALAILVAGLIPILVLHRAMAGHSGQRRRH